MDHAPRREVDHTPKEQTCKTDLRNLFSGAREGFGPNKPVTFYFHTPNAVLIASCSTAFASGRQIVGQIAPHGACRKPVPEQGFYRM
jgi:hypothetical protein